MSNVGPHNVPKLELIVDRVLNDGRFVVVNSSSITVPLGTVFVELQSRLAVREGEAFREHPLSVPSAVKLEVVEIESWQKLTDVLPKGHNAAVRLKGEGVDQLQEHILRKPKSVFIFIASAASEA